MSSSATTRSHALIIGGSVAGLLAARVLADHFARVTVIERDHYPADPVFRPGTPQARHAHILLMRGQQLLDEFFPGFIDALQAQGAQQVDITNDFVAKSEGQWFPRYPSHQYMYPCSRSLIDWLIRRELGKFPQVQFMPEQEVVGLLATVDGRTITGVRLRAREGKAPDESTMTELHGDLVIDASGRHSHAPEWLKSLGYTPPTESTINAHIGYATRIFAAPPAGTHPWKVLYLGIQPPDLLRGGMTWPLEGGKQWLVGLGGVGADSPPTDEAGYMEFIRALPDTTLYEAVKDLEPLTPVYGYRDTANFWRHYEHLSRMPEQFVLVGDAVCAFDPVYGQGMTVAALDAQLLGQSLRRYQGQPLTGFAHQFQQAMAKINTVPWQLATSVDLRIPGVEGEGESTTAATRLIAAYLGRVTKRMSRSPYIRKTFNDVTHLLAPPTAFFTPAIAMRALLLPQKSNNTRPW